MSREVHSTSPKTDRPATDEELKATAQVDTESPAIDLEEIDKMMPALATSAWKRQLLLIGACIPFDVLTDPKEIAENAGTPLAVDLNKGCFTFCNFEQIGPAGVARLKVALLMHVMEQLQAEVLRDIETEKLLKTMKVDGDKAGA